MLIAASDQPVMDNIRTTGASELVTSTPDGLAAFQVEESKRWGEVIRAAGIVPE